MVLASQNDVDVKSPVYVKAAPPLSMLAVSVATTSQIISMKSDIANQTYSINFTGPALKCADANSTMAAKLGHLSLDDTSLFYLAWIGDAAPWLQVENSTFQESTLQNYTFHTSAPDNFGGNPTKRADNNLWIMTRNRTIGAYVPFNVKECQLWNASYEIEFAFCNFEQTTTIHNFAYQNPILSVSTVDSNATSAWFHKVVLSGFGSLMVGANVEHPTRSYQRSLLVLFDLLNTQNSTRFGEVLEEVFQNITLSLFSVPGFSYVSRDFIIEY